MTPAGAPSDTVDDTIGSTASVGMETSEVTRSYALRPVAKVTTTFLQFFCNRPQADPLAPVWGSGWKASLGISGLPIDFHHGFVRPLAPVPKAPEPAVTKGSWEPTGRAK